MLFCSLEEGKSNPDLSVDGVAKMLCVWFCSCLPPEELLIAFAGESYVVAPDLPEKTLLPVFGVAKGPELFAVLWKSLEASVTVGFVGRRG